MNYRKVQVDKEAPSFYHKYINRVETDDLVAYLKEEQQKSIDFYKQLPSDKWDYKYGEDKWSIREVLLHLIDTERIMSYRALRIARNDKTALPGFDQDMFVPTSNADKRSPESLIAEYQTVRQASITLFDSFDDESRDRMGTASDNPVSALALAHIVAGHEQHHLEIVRERYL